MAKTRPDWGNVSQIVSAVCALALALLAIYGFFFSKTSQALVSYLQSELASRNQRIASLELREKELQLAVSTAQATLTELSAKKVLAEKQVASLIDEQEVRSKKIAELDQTLSNAQFSLVRERINTTISSTINVEEVFLDDKLDTAEGVKAQTVHPWDAEFSYIKKVADEMPEPDKSTANTVISNFIMQCDRYRSLTVQIPALRIPKGTDFAPYDYDRSKHPTAIRLAGLTRQIEKIRSDIVECFRRTTP